MAALGRGATTDTTIKPDEVVFDAETDRLLRLLRTSGTDECLPKFVYEIKSGLSYRQFLTVLFLAAIENGDPHQVAQVFGAHRISTDVRVEERLLPLFLGASSIEAGAGAGQAGTEAIQRHVARSRRSQHPSSRSVAEIRSESG